LAARPSSVSGTLASSGHAGMRRAYAHARRVFRRSVTDVFGIARLRKIQDTIPAITSTAITGHVRCTVSASIGRAVCHHRGA
jgi:hypothetical protein